MESTNNLGISPFSMEKSYRVIWRQEEVPLHGNIKLNDAQKQTLKRMGILKVCTTNQLAKQLNRTQLRRGKDLVNDLRKKGIINLHWLEDENSSRVPFYALSPIVAEKIGIKPITKALDVREIIKGMIFSQLYVRFLEVDETVEVLPFPNPFEGAFTIFGNDFRIGVIRGDMRSFQNHFLYHNEQMKTLLVVEDLVEANQLSHVNAHPIRLTTDYHILKEDLSVSFYKLDGDNWVRVSIPNFKKVQKSAQHNELIQDK